MDRRATLLLIETSAELCSVALCRGPQILGEKNILEKNAHSRLLAPMVQEVLAKNNFSYDALDAICVSAGPGSYTGLRIGASLAKGICYAQNIPLIAVSSLASLQSAATESEQSKYVCSLIDARRQDVYYALYDIENRIIGTEAFVTITPNFLLDELNEHQIDFVGSGAAKCSKIISHKNAHFFDLYASAKHLKDIALEKYLTKDFEDLAYFEPNYIKSVHITAAKKTHFN